MTKFKLDGISARREHKEAEDTALHEEALHWRLVADLTTVADKALSLGLTHDEIRQAFDEALLPKGDGIEV